tara:strand:- start:222 stop:329 length:108 start_codon:yes stop_codon:yes gene_type:complete
MNDIAPPRPVDQPRETPKHAVPPPPPPPTRPTRKN